MRRNWLMHLFIVTKLQRAKELRREMTPAEKILWEELRANKLGVHFYPLCPHLHCTERSAVQVFAAKIFVCS